MKKGCIFCDRQTFSETLISNQRNFRITASRGQITNGYYLLLIPKRHARCLGEMDQNEIRDVVVLADFIQRGLAFELKCADGTPCKATFFEHGIVGQTIQHAHLHILPASVSFTDRIRNDFPTSEIDSLVSLRDLSRAYNLNKEPYLFWQSPGQAPMVCWDPPAPKQYLRTVAAEKLEVSERADWQTVDPELDKKWIAATIERIEKWFM